MTLLTIGVRALIGYPSPMKITASKVRRSIGRVLDHVAETGEPVEVEHRGKRLRIVSVEAVATSKLARLERRPDAIRCDPDDLVHMDWPAEWKRRSSRHAFIA